MELTARTMLISINLKVRMRRALILKPLLLAIKINRYIIKRRNNNNLWKLLELKKRRNCPEVHRKLLVGQFTPIQGSFLLQALKELLPCCHCF